MRSLLGRRSPPVSFVGVGDVPGDVFAAVVDAPGEFSDGDLVWFTRNDHDLIPDRLFGLGELPGKRIAVLAEAVKFHGCGRFVVVPGTARHERDCRMQTVRGCRDVCRHFRVRDLIP